MTWCSIFSGSQIGNQHVNKMCNFFVEYFQLRTEVSEAISLLTFLEETRDGVVTGNNDLFKQALKKQQEIERKKRRIETLESTLGVHESHEKKTEALAKGKHILATFKRNETRQEIELFFDFAKSEEHKSIDRLDNKLYFI